MKTILVTGATGQIGSELTMALRKRHGDSNVVAGGRKTKPTEKLLNSGPFEVVDCLNVEAVANIVKKYKVDTIYHLAAILSAVAEAKPSLAWNVNINGLYNVLEVAREHNCAVFIPSSIGAFGSATPLDSTPQDTIQRPSTMYGVTKVAGELLCDYYFTRFGIDTRGVRYPGIISNETLPGGGTTDYAVEIYYEAIKHKKYTCDLPAGTFLDMMYMPDAIKAAINLMEADPAKLIHRNAFNVTAMNFDPEIIAQSIRKYIPEFTMDYKVNAVKESIAASWPNSMDDSAAREEWGWTPDYDLDTMTADMLEVLSQKLQRQE
ncbi:MAG: L-threonine 3-dehydrogenase [Desulfocapsaceae bacterium]|jgi:nucleoside-diphosphate-sugar epimerase|nr:L-threonine 3-dehydrogenase [Desulfocapsaceae bacterium]